jgi:hypothetical protein
VTLEDLVISGGRGHGGGGSGGSRRDVGYKSRGLGSHKKL